MAMIMTPSKGNDLQQQQLNAVVEHNVEMKNELNLALSSVKHPLAIGKRWTTLSRTRITTPSRGSEYFTFFFSLKFAHLAAQ